jgi:hypothetical protein
MLKMLPVDSVAAKGFHDDFNARQEKQAVPIDASVVN